MTDEQRNVVHERANQILADLGIEAAIEIEDEIYDADKDPVTVLVNEVLSAVNRTPRQVAIRALYVALTTVRKPEPAISFGLEPDA